MPIIGFLGAGRRALAPCTDAFRERPREPGWIEGRTSRSSTAGWREDSSALPRSWPSSSASQSTLLPQRQPSVPHLKACDTAIPIVFPASARPDRAGLVKSLAQPGGNVTGRRSLLDVS